MFWNATIPGMRATPMKLAYTPVILRTKEPFEGLRYVSMATANARGRPRDIQPDSEEFFSSPGALMLFCVTLSSTGAQDRSAAPASLQGGIVKLPVVDKQDIRFTRVSVNNVPFQASTFELAQDQYGFLWFGTVDGLLRYDGYNLKSYKHDTGNPNSLTENEVKSVYTDRSGILWIGTPHGGLDRLDPAQDTFTHYRHDPGNQQSLSSNDVRCVYQDPGARCGLEPAAASTAWTWLLAVSSTTGTTPGMRAA